MINNVVLGTSNTDIVTVPVGETYSNVVLVLCNTTAVDATVNIYAVPNGSSAGDSTIILKELTVQAKDTFLFESRLILSGLDKIIGLASAGSTITATSSYIQM